MFQYICILNKNVPWLRRRVKESIFILEKAPTLNRDKGYELPAIYQHVVSRGDLHGSPSHVTQQH
jgi:hypothetical protein